MSKVKVNPYKRKGKTVSGYERSKRTRSRKKKIERTEYRVLVLRDPKTGWIVGTKKTKIRKRK